MTLEADNQGIPVALRSASLPAACRSPWTPNKAAYEAMLDSQPRFRQDQLWQGLYDHNQAPEDISGLPKSLRSELNESLNPALKQGIVQRSSDGKTLKWVSNLPDGPSIETVLMHYKRRSTVCVSSQAGCGMDCGFCATGQAGLDRNLSVGEILEQLVEARRLSGDRRVSNVVFMGMGEPLANYDRVATCLHRITSDFGIGARHITVSTIGLAPQIELLANEGLQIGLAVSLHGANDDLRSELVPLNRRYPIESLVEASLIYRERTGRRVSFEWAMIDGVNDSLDDAHELAVAARKAFAHVNLIPLNPTPGWPTVGSPPSQIEAFVSELRHKGVDVTVRANRGTDIDAACGQLATKAPA